jgi:hypothetical protein
MQQDATLKNKKKIKKIFLEQDKREPNELTHNCATPTHKRVTFEIPQLPRNQNIKTQAAPERIN